MPEIKISRFVFQGIISQIGRAPIDTGLNDLHVTLKAILNDHLQNHEQEQKEQSKPAIKKSAPAAPVAKSNKPALKLAREFVTNNPDAKPEDVLKHLMDKHQVKSATAKSTAYKVFRDKK